MSHSFHKKGKLYLVGTPIGNLKDITLRALDTLRLVDVIAAEDTRRTLGLLNHYEIKKPLISYHEHNERKSGQKILSLLDAGQSIALVSDAGTPAISDPGQRLVKEARQMGIEVLSIPGVSAVTAALSISGFECPPCIFLGFPPARGKKRKEFFTYHAKEPMTMVLFESPVRFLKTLKDILSYWGNRDVFIARELTKSYEEIFWGTVEEALSHWTERVRGEITLVVSGISPQPQKVDISLDLELSIANDLKELVSQQGLSWRDAIRKVAEEKNLPRGVVYRNALRIQQGD